MTHGLLVSHPGTNSGRLGMRSWQYPPPGSMRPLVIGWRSARGAVLRSHSMQSSRVRSRLSVWPLQRAMSLGSMSGGLLRHAADVPAVHRHAAIDRPNQCWPTSQVATTADGFDLQRLRVVAVLVLDGKSAAIHASHAAWVSQSAFADRTRNFGSCRPPDVSALNGQDGFTHDASGGLLGLARLQVAVKRLERCKSGVRYMPIHELRQPGVGNA